MLYCYIVLIVNIIKHEKLQLTQADISLKSSRNIIVSENNNHPFSILPIVSSFTNSLLIYSSVCNTHLKNFGKTNYNNIYNVVNIIIYIIKNIFLKTNPLMLIQAILRLYPVHNLAIWFLNPKLNLYLYSHSISVLDIKNTLW